MRVPCLALGVIRTSNEDYPRLAFSGPVGRQGAPGSPRRRRPSDERGFAFMAKATRYVPLLSTPSPPRPSCRPRSPAMLDRLIIDVGAGAASPLPGVEAI